MQDFTARLSYYPANEKAELSVHVQQRIEGEELEKYARCNFDGSIGRALEYLAHKIHAALRLELER